jgi:hypothetical protein
LTYVLKQLRNEKGELFGSDAHGKLIPGDEVSCIAGWHLGYSGASDGTFALLIPYFRNRATAEDVELMLKDKSAAVRIMGAYLVLTDGKFGRSAPPREINSRKVSDLSLKSLEGDKTPVLLNTGGCIIQESSVTEVIKLMREYPGIFEERRPLPESESK